MRSTADILFLVLAVLAGSSLWWPGEQLGLWLVLLVLLSIPLITWWLVSALVSSQNPNPGRRH